MLYFKEYHQQVRLEMSTRKLIDAADGYSYLGMHEEAMSELALACAEDTDSPEFLAAAIRVVISQAVGEGNSSERWSMVEESLRRLVEQYADNVELTVQLVFVLCRRGKGDEADTLLHNNPNYRTGILHYNLACYEAKFGDVAMASKLLKVVGKLNPDMRKKSRTDPDLYLANSSS